MMDVSGSMTDEQKEIVRIEAFWIDTWLKAHYKGIETRLHHPRRRRPGGGRAHLLPHPRERRHQDQLGLRAGRQDHRRSAIRPTEWNIYAFHFSDGDNWGDDIPQLHRAPDREAAAEAEPVRLRPGRKPLRQRRVLRVRPRAARRARTTWSRAASPTATRSWGRSRSSWARDDECRPRCSCGAHPDVARAGSQLQRIA